jgi:lipopolysaccharide transport system permease protein
MSNRASAPERVHASLAWRHLEPPHGLASLKVAELWRYRELVYFLTWRDILVRYKQAVLGVLWAIVQPVLTMIVFSVIFGRLIGVQSGDVPYPVFSFAGLLPWQLFAGAMQRSGTSLVASAGLITKVYFPRLVIPLSSILGGVIDFCISLAVLAALMAYYHMAPTWDVLWLPAFVLLALATSFAVGLWLSALNVLYRDVQYIIPFLIQLWMYLSPVVYPVTYITGPFRYVYALNPMVGVIQGFRWALYGGTPPDRLVAVSVAVVAVLLVTGLYYFRHMERTFADVV